MWYRDYVLVRERARELEAEARTHAAGAELVAAARTRRQGPGLLRSTAAGGARWIGTRALAIARRLEEQCADAERYVVQTTTAR